MKDLQDFERTARDVCWFILCHLLGLSNYEISLYDTKISEDRDENLKSIKDNWFISTLLELADKIYQIQSIRSNTSENHSKEVCNIYEEMVGILDKLINPQADSNNVKSPLIGKECKRNDSKLREGNDDPEKGYSRAPYKKIKDEHIREIVLAAVLYIVRAYAYFFCRPRLERGFNCAKVALNDLFQASKLVTRIQNSFLSQDYYMKIFLKEHKIKWMPFNHNPWDTPYNSYFIGCLRLLIEIQRGNIYHQIYYLEEGERYYQKAQEHFDFLIEEPLKVELIDIEKRFPKYNGHSIFNYFLTPTLIRALSERSKILFDKGFFAESLMNQLRCLSYLVLINYYNSRSKIESRLNMNEISNKEAINNFEEEKQKIEKPLKNLSNALNCLNDIRKQALFDKEKITKLFGITLNGISSDETIIKPDDFREILKSLSSNMKEYTADLFARIGYTIFIFRQYYSFNIFWEDELEKKSTSYQKEFSNWIVKFFTAGKDLFNLERMLPIAKYNKNTISEDSNDKDNQQRLTFPDSLEREFSFRLRQNIKDYSIASLDEKGFYFAVLDYITQNIDNIITSPRCINSFLMRPGYKERRSLGDLSGRTVSESLKKSHEVKSMYLNDYKGANKFVVLRRWQSFNPKIPRPRDNNNVRGGGCFLLWRGKGIVIDPGYDFIQNFYEEGFSVNDIDAVVITHSHPDHDDDFSSLTTLIREWNSYHEKMGYEKDELSKIDVFLNESTHIKFSAWLKATGKGIGKVIPLPLVVWEDYSTETTEAIRGKNVIIYLREKYYLDIEVVPAWHNDVIGRTSAVGLKLHLFSETHSDTENKVAIIGYTGDTMAYNLKSKDNKNGETKSLSINDQYSDCDMLIAHLGDIRLRELSRVLKEKNPETGNIVSICINSLLIDWFCKEDRTVDNNKVTPKDIKEFLSLLISLNLVSEETLNVEIDKKYCKENKPIVITISNAIHDFIYNEGEIIKNLDIFKGDKNKVLGKVEQLLTYSGSHVKIASLFTEMFPDNYVFKATKIKDNVIILLAILCSSSETKWTYRYHLGISGIYNLYKAMIESKENNKINKIFIVGELPEELASCRHHIAKLLNISKINKTNDNKKVHSFTGDIGLHISLTSKNNDEIKWHPKVRCTYCNYNNETVLRKENYHSPEKIIETPLKKLNSSMIWLCTEYDHYPENIERPLDFLSNPDLRII